MNLLIFGFRAVTVCVVWSGGGGGKRGERGGRGRGSVWRCNIPDSTEYSCHCCFNSWIWYSLHLRNPFAGLKIKILWFYRLTGMVKKKVEERSMRKRSTKMWTSQCVFIISLWLKLQYVFFVSCCLIHFEYMPLPSTVSVSLACHIVLRVAWRLCMTAPRGWPLPLDIRITFAPYRFRDRSIPELDEILDAKLSEVQDHMRTLMQKQVRVCQPPWVLFSCRCSGRYLLEDDETIQAIRIWVCRIVLRTEEDGSW